MKQGLGIIDMSDLLFAEEDAFVIIWAVIIDNPHGSDESIIAANHLRLPVILVSGECLCVTNIALILN